jgi:hypothetical protein
VSSSGLVAQGWFGPKPAQVEVDRGVVRIAVGHEERTVSLDACWMEISPPDLSFHLVLAALLASLGGMWLLVSEAFSAQDGLAILAIVGAMGWVGWAVTKLRWTVVIGTRAEFLQLTATVRQHGRWSSLAHTIASSSALSRAWRREEGLIAGLIEAARLVSDPTEARLRALYELEKPVLGFEAWALPRVRRAWGAVLLSGATPVVVGVGVGLKTNLVSGFIAAMLSLWAGSWLGNLVLRGVESREGIVATLRPMFRHQP